MVSADLAADPPLWEQPPVPTTAVPDPGPPGPEAAEEDEDVDDEAADEGDTHSAAAVGTAVVVALADALAEAESDELAAGVAVVTRPHADAVSDARRIRGRLARPEVARMPAGCALNLGFACGIAQGRPSVSPAANQTSSRATILRWRAVIARPPKMSRRTSRMVTAAAALARAWFWAPGSCT